MRYLSVILALSMVISLAVGTEQRSRPETEQTIYDRIHKKADLPTGGEFVKHPKNPKVQYYFTNRLRMWKDKSNTRKHAGLYISEDDGDTWNLRCNFFEFQKLFIHPETGKLYCIIDYTWLKENKEGFLWPHFANKALMSEDGKHWKDITEGNGYIANIFGIMEDPDNPGRVCLQACVIRAYILQSKDDAYSKWTWYKVWEWPNRKGQKTSQQADAPDKK